MFGFCCGLGGFYDGPSQLALPSCSCFCVEACCSTSLPSRSWYGPVLWQKWSELTHENSADIFKQFDYNSNGELEASELRNFLKAAFPRTELSKEELSELVTQFDSDQNGTIGLNELRAFLRCYNPESKTIQRKTALLVIDVQNDFISGSLAVQNSETIVKVINQIRDKFDCVVISYDWHPQDHCSFVESANDGKVKIKETEGVGTFQAFSQVTLLGDQDRAEHSQMLYPRHCVQKTWGSECHKDLVVKKEDMSVYKGQKANIDSYSAFFDNCKANDTGLTKQLEDAGVTDVYCCGLVFDICVKSSALHGAENGFRVSVIEDACKPLNETEVEGTRKLLANAGVQVMSSAEATREVSVQMSGSMPLKEFLQSVKSHKHAAALHKSEHLASHCPSKVKS
ncbi:Nicotinamidase (Nicotinamide deamidase) (NAMase) (Pyrazinamidase) (PZAase) [Durusdinium trenchii]|uniref:nicotinamidase n=1 Tax=Durusdinium trenchii TaxID=1381693 RepID=A0ABP0R926_9DINO